MVYSLQNPMITEKNAIIITFNCEFIMKAKVLNNIELCICRLFGAISNELRLQKK